MAWRETFSEEMTRAFSGWRRISGRSPRFAAMVRPGSTGVLILHQPANAG
jgi:hypothetical protein